MLIRQNSLRTGLLRFVALLALAGCTVPQEAATYGLAYATKPHAPPPADTKDQIPQHESWCYETMGYSECYAHPQDVATVRFINVDPANKYPVDLAAYHEALAQGPAATARPVDLQPAAAIPVEQGALKPVAGTAVTANFPPANTAPAANQKPADTAPAANAAPTPVAPAGNVRMP